MPDRVVNLPQLTVMSYIRDTKLSSLFVKKTALAIFKRQESNGEGAAKHLGLTVSRCLSGEPGNHVETMYRYMFFTLLFFIH